MKELIKSLTSMGLTVTRDGMIIYDNITFGKFDSNGRPAIYCYPFICWDDDQDKEWLDSSESISVDDEFYDYYEQFCADYHSLFNYNKMGGISLCGSVSKHDVNIVELIRDVLQIYKEIVRDLREKAIQNF